MFVIETDNNNGIARVLEGGKELYSFVNVKLSLEQMENGEYAYIVRAADTPLSSMIMKLPQTKSALIYIGRAGDYIKKSE